MAHQVSKHAAYNINYHIVFCPKRRRPVLVGNIAKDVETLFVQILESLSCTIHSIAIQPDHVHIFVSCKPNLSPHKIVKELKSRTSRVLREKYTVLEKMPSMWSRSYYAGTTGFVSESVVRLYIEAQKGR